MSNVNLIGALLACLFLDSPTCACDLQGHITALRSGSTEDRVAAFKSLECFSTSQLDNKETLEAVCSILGDRDHALRRFAIVLLERIVGDGARNVGGIVEYLESQLVQASATHRCDVIDAIGVIGPAAVSALPKLEPLLADDSGLGIFYGARAAVAMRRIDPTNKKPMDALISGLTNGSEITRWLCAYGIGQLRRNGAVAKRDLVEAMSDSSPSVRVLAAGALWRVLGEPEIALPVLIRALDEEPRAVFLAPLRGGSLTSSHTSFAICYLGEMGESAKPAAERLAQAADGKDYELRLVALISLGKIGVSTEKVLDVVKRHTANDDPRIQRAATEAYEKISRSRTME